MHVVAFWDGCVYAGMHKRRSVLGMRVQRAAPLDSLHLLAATVTHCPWTLGPGTPLLDTFAVFVTPRKAALPADALALLIRGWEPAGRQRWEAGRPHNRASRRCSRNRGVVCWERVFERQKKCNWGIILTSSLGLFSRGPSNGGSKNVGL